MLQDVASRNQIFRDDQQVFVRYLLENPHLATIDNDRKLFLTGFKEPLYNHAMSYILGMKYKTVASRESVALIHCNSKESNHAYYRLK